MCLKTRAALCFFAWAFGKRQNSKPTLSAWREWWEREREREGKRAVKKEDKIMPVHNPIESVPCISDYFAWKLKLIECFRGIEWANEWDAHFYNPNHASLPLTFRQKCYTPSTIVMLKCFDSDDNGARRCEKAQTGRLCENNIVDRVVNSWRWCDASYWIYYNHVINFINCK